MKITLNKKIVIIVLVVFLIYSALSFAVYMTVYDIMKNKNLQMLTEKVSMVKDLISIFNDTSKKSANKIADVFAAMFKELITLDRARTMNINGIETPVLISGGTVLNMNNQYVDRLTDITSGSVATIFVRKGNDFIRIATSLKKEDGSRAMGTALGKSHPAFNKLIKGDKYTGKANLFGRDYMTSYTPIKEKNGDIIGVLFVGFDITDALKSMTDYIMSLKVTGKGFFFIIDEGNERTQNSLLIHISEDEQRAKDILKEIIQNKEGVYHIRDTNSLMFKGDEKTLVYGYYKDWGWITGIGVGAEVIMKEIIIIRNIMLVVGIISIIILSSLFFVATYR